MTAVLATESSRLTFLPAPEEVPGNIRSVPSALHGSLFLGPTLPLPHTGRILVLIKLGCLDFIFSPGKPTLYSNYDVTVVTGPSWKLCSDEPW